MKVAGLVLLNPDPNQVSADVVALGEPVKGLAGQELLSDLALELDALRAVLGHGLPSFESPARRSILSRPTVRREGSTPSVWELFLRRLQEAVFRSELDLDGAVFWSSA